MSRALRRRQPPDTRRWTNLLPPPGHTRGMRAQTWCGAAVAALALSACTASTPADTRTRDREPTPAVDEAVATPPERRGHPRLRRRRALRGARRRAADAARASARSPAPSAAADVAMVNLETPVTVRGRRDPKELEFACDRYYFRTPPPRARRARRRRASTWSRVANNHAGDYGQVGLADTLRAARRQRGRGGRCRTRRRGGVHAARGRGRTASTWPSWPPTPCSARAPAACGRPVRGNAGIAAARGSRTDRLLDAVESAAAEQDAGRGLPALGPGVRGVSRRRASACSAATSPTPGADVVVGSHSHVLGGAGWSGDTYVVLRARQLRLVPRPPARHRRPDPAPRRGRRGRGGLDPGAHRGRRTAACR